MAFAVEYAALYDRFYADKDYLGECCYLRKLLQRSGVPPRANLLDVGSGTGSHAIPLSRMGYAVTGLDPSVAMLDVARRKASAAGVPVRFVEGYGQSLDLHARFQALICMFNVTGYITATVPLRDFLRGVHRQLESGGLFIFDFRHGLPALTRYTPMRSRWFETSGGRALRFSETRLEPMGNLMHTVYTVLLFEGERLVGEFRDEHSVRFLFTREVEEALADAGFELLKMGAFLDVDTPAIPRGMECHGRRPCLLSPHACSISAILKRLPLFSSALRDEPCPQEAMVSHRLCWEALTSNLGQLHLKRLEGATLFPLAARSFFGSPYIQGSDPPRLRVQRSVKRTLHYPGETELPKRLG